MNYNSKNYQTTEELKVLNEPVVEYQASNRIIETNLDGKYSGLLDRLLDIGMKQCEDGLLIPHDVVMAEIRRKYNIVK